MRINAISAANAISQENRSLILHPLALTQLSCVSTMIKWRYEVGPKIVRVRNTLPLSLVTDLQESHSLQ